MLSITHVVLLNFTQNTRYILAAQGIFIDNAVGIFLEGIFAKIISRACVEVWLAQVGKSQLSQIPTETQFTCFGKKKKSLSDSFFCLSWPAVKYGHCIIFIRRPDLYIQEELLAWKLLDAYNYFQNGYVRTILRERSKPRKVKRLFFLNSRGGGGGREGGASRGSSQSVKEGWTTPFYKANSL